MRGSSTLSQSTSTAVTWSSCWAATCTCRGACGSAWPWTSPGDCSTCTAKASSTGTSPPRTAWCAGRAACARRWWETLAWRRRSQITVRMRSRSLWLWSAPPTGWPRRCSEERCIMRRWTCLHTGSSCVRLLRGYRPTPTSCHALRNLVWMWRPFSRWWETVLLTSWNWPSPAMNAKVRPSFSQIVVELERRQAERKQKDEPVKAVCPVIGSLRRRSLCLPSDPRLSRSKSDMLHPPDVPASVTMATPARVNPFSRREDLKGGKIKLFDTPSKSVISLTFTLPPPPDCDDPSATETDGGDQPRRHRRCHSLPCTPPPHLTSAPNTVLTEEEVDAVNGETNGGSEEERLLGEEMEVREGSDSGLPLSLEPLSLDEEKEAEDGEEEPMDCTSSPDTQDSTSSPYSKLSPPPSHSSTPRQPSTPPFSNGWGSAISNGPPCLPPLSNLDNNNVVVSRPLGWSANTTTAPTTTNNNGYHSPPSDPAGSSPFGSGSGHSLDQEEVVSCPGCCLAGLRFPSMCLRAPPHRNPYKNLNGDHAASRGLLCPGPKGLPPSPTPTTTTTSLEPGLSLPGAQT
ncbi:dual specificity testis-specific protein kinase 1 isoform 2-T2 [Symphorus nematophorus]